MEEKILKYEELGLTESQNSEALDYLSKMRSDLGKKPDGEQLRKLFDRKYLTFGEKFYIAYLFGRIFQVVKLVPADGLTMETNEKTDDVKTTEKYWDCECEKNFIHPKTQSRCDICGALEEEQPDSRINEVLTFGFPL